MPKNTNKNHNDNLKNEIKRKLIHLSSLWIPVFLYLSSGDTVLDFLVPLTIIFVVVDYFRNKNGFINNTAQKFLGGMLRKHEEDKLSGASFFLIASVVSIIAFPEIVAFTALSVLIISDICAALIGKKYGKIKIIDKTLEGSIAFYVSGLLVVLIAKFIYNAEYRFVIISALSLVVATLTELISKKLTIDDNVSIPIIMGLTTLVIYNIY